MSTAALVRIETLTAIDIFKPGAIDPLLEQIKSEVRAQAANLDIATESSRKEIASLAYKVARSKTFIDDQRKALVADEKRRLKAIDEEGSRVWDELEALQKEVRKPLTDWENAEKERVAGHEFALKQMADLSIVTGLHSVADIERLINEVGQIAARDWQEFAGRAKKVSDCALFILDGLLMDARKAESERAELDRLRIEAAERAQRIEHEQHIEKQKQDAAKREKEAAEKAERDRVAAIEAERQRVADQLARDKEEQQARERNRAHRAKVNRQVRDAIVALGIAEDQAEMVVIAIAKRAVPHVTIAY